MPEQKMSYEERRAKTRKTLQSGQGCQVSDLQVKIEMDRESRAIRDGLQGTRDKLFIDTYLLDHGYIEPKTDVIASEYAKQAESRCIPKNDKSTLQIIKDATERTDDTH